jgi:hypothetical protein
VTLDGDGERARCLQPMILRNWRSASSMPAAIHLRHMSPLDQCFTLCEVRRQISIIDSIGFVEDSVRQELPIDPEPLRRHGLLESFA